MGFPGGSVVKNLPANTGDPGSIPGSGRSPREGNGNPLQYSYLGNPMDRGTWKLHKSIVLQTAGHDLATKQSEKKKKGYKNVLVSRIINSSHPFKIM